MIGVGAPAPTPSPDPELKPFHRVSTSGAAAGQRSCTSSTRHQGLEKVSCGPGATTDFFQDRARCRASSLARCGTAGRYPLKGLQIGVWSGRWCPHSNHCSALAALRTTHTADQNISFRQVATQRQLVCRARQPGRTKNRLRSCRTRGERPRPSGDTMPQRVAACWAPVTGIFTRCENKDPCKYSPALGSYDPLP